jgi:hypothetical protein
MPRYLLSARQVQTARGDLPDGDGLILRLGANGASWTLRFTSPSGKRWEFGLGRVGCATAQRPLSGAARLIRLRRNGFNNY